MPTPPTDSAASRRTTLPAPPPKKCGCGAEHDTFAWLRLPYVGVMTDSVESLELRNCPCGSTLAIEVAA